MADISKIKALDGVAYDLKDASARNGLANKANTTEAIKNITRNGITYTVTRCDGTTFTFNQQDVPQNVFIGELAVWTDPNTMVTWYQAGIYTWKEDNEIPSSLAEKSLFILYTNTGRYTTDEPGTSNYLYVGIDICDGDIDSMPGYPVTSVSAKGTWGAYRYSNNTFTRIDDFDFSFVRALLPTKKKIVDMVYPVGSIYMSVNQVSPSSLFGGTWVQLKDRFLLGVGDTYGVSETTGGAASVQYTPAGSNTPCTLTTAQIPSHNHTFTGIAVNSGDNSVGHTHEVGAHAHGLNSHKHSVGAHAHGLNSHTHTGPSHAHTVSAHTHNVTLSTGAQPVAIDASSTAYTGEVRKLKVGSTYVSQGTLSNVKNLYLIAHSDGAGSTGNAGTGATGAATGNTANSTAFDSGAATGNTANSTAFNSGGVSANHTHSVTAKGTIGSTGGGEEHNHTFTGTTSTINTMPPYLTVYMWKRTA